MKSLIQSIWFLCGQIASLACAAPKSVWSGYRPRGDRLRARGSERCAGTKQGLAAIVMSHVALLTIMLSPWNVARAQSSQAGSAAPSPPSLPAMAGPLTVNPNPMSFEAGPLGKVWITGAVSGVAQWQNSVFPGDRSGLVDLSNAQVFFNKTDGLVQFFVQLGTYSIPDLGLPYLRAVNATKAFYGPFPQGFLKLAP